MNKRTLEQYPPIDLRLIMRHRGQRNTFTFRLNHGDNTFAKGCINIQDQTATINGHEVPLVSLPAGFGGHTWLFKCPGCDRQCCILYPTPSECLCRKCLGLVYQTQQATKTDWTAIYHQAEKVAQRIDPSFHFTDYLQVMGSTWELFPERPKLMHWTTYERMLRRYTHYVEKGSKLQAAEYAAFRKQMNTPHTR